MAKINISNATERIFRNAIERATGTIARKTGGSGISRSFFLIRKPVQDEETETKL
ncbi:hypothetical protein [Planomicrobium sp. CPCC 101110]|uniref:hypothetical protein n=1 Tax=Planomicrobium sp. CPCC 101110 TaxID=2599619 RepID=UPI00164480B1|nr:hypothetical protein [Planomicrobium sp. CPCC 101110]